jgi:hypothetical protein
VPAKRDGPKRLAKYLRFLGNAEPVKLLVRQERARVASRAARLPTKDVKAFARLGCERSLVATEVAIKRVVAGIQRLHESRDGVQDAAKRRLAAERPLETVLVFGNLPQPFNHEPSVGVHELRVCNMVANHVVERRDAAVPVECLAMRDVHDARRVAKMKRSRISVRQRFPVGEPLRRVVALGAREARVARKARVEKEHSPERRLLRLRLRRGRHWGEDLRWRRRRIGRESSTG